MGDSAGSFRKNDFSEEGKEWESEEEGTEESCSKRNQIEQQWQ